MCCLKKVFIIPAIIIILIFQGCSDEITSPENDFTAEILSDTRIIRTNETTILKLNIQGIFPDALNFAWETSKGLIEPSGNSALFKAPAERGETIVKVKVTDNKNRTVTAEIKLEFYKKLVILKADDMVYDQLTAIPVKWKRFVDLIKDYNVKASIGLIGNSLERGNLTYIEYLKDLYAEGRFELWNHGYNHLLNGRSETAGNYTEFRNSGYEYQKEHLLKTQLLAREKLGITLRAFGAPGNGIDENTLKAIEEIDELKMWFYGLTQYSGLLLPRSNEIEFPVNFPDYNKFVENYDADSDLMILQIHPNAWSDKGFDEFERVIEYLTVKEYTFINPMDYYQLKVK